MLKQVNEIVYLGVTLSQDPCAHVDKRMKATRNSFYALQGAGMCKNGCSPEAISLLFKTVIQPCLTHGCESVFQNKVAIDRLAKYQNKLLKSSLGLKPCCHSTPLLQGTKICTVKDKIDFQELGLLRRMFYPKLVLTIFILICFRRIQLENTLVNLSCVGFVRRVKIEVFH